MKILFDNNMPRQLRRPLSGHEVRTAKEMQWTLLENGDLLHAAEDSGFDVMVTGDKNLPTSRISPGVASLSSF